MPLIKAVFIFAQYALTAASVSAGGNCSDLVHASVGDIGQKVMLQRKERYEASVAPSFEDGHEMQKGRAEAALFKEQEEESEWEANLDTFLDMQKEEHEHEFTDEHEELLVEPTKDASPLELETGTPDAEGEKSIMELHGSQGASLAPQIADKAFDFTIRVKSNTEVCMNAQTGTGGIRPGIPVALWTCTAAANEQWEYRADDTIRLKSNPELCMSALTGTGGLRPTIAIALWKCTAAANEQWEYRADDNTIRVKSRPELCMNAASGDLKQGDAILLWTCSAGANEQFPLTRALPRWKNTGCNWQCYADRYPTVQMYCQEQQPWNECVQKHYETWGRERKLDCTCRSVSFETCNWQCYLERYPGVAKAFARRSSYEYYEGAAATHFEQFGYREGRDCTCPPCQNSRGLAGYNFVGYGYFQDGANREFGFPNTGRPDYQACLGLCNKIDKTKGCPAFFTHADGACFYYTDTAKFWLTDSHWRNSEKYETFKKCR